MNAMKVYGGVLDIPNFVDVVELNQYKNNLCRHRMCVLLITHPVVGIHLYMEKRKSVPVKYAETQRTLLSNAFISHWRTQFMSCVSVGEKQMITVFRDSGITGFLTGGVA